MFCRFFTRSWICRFSNESCLFGARSVAPTSSGIPFGLVKIPEVLSEESLKREWNGCLNLMHSILCLYLYCYQLRNAKCESLAESWILSSLFCRQHCHVWSWTSEAWEIMITRRPLQYRDHQARGSWKVNRKESKSWKRKSKSNKASKHRLRPKSINQCPQLKHEPIYIRI